jgi:thiol-disulfide isomerase/thioredoxin
MQLDGSEDNMDVRVFDGLKVKTLDKGEDAEISLSGSDHTLMILISAGDCPSCLRENEVYKQLAETYSKKQLRIVFLFVRSTLDEAKTLTKSYNFPSEVYFDGQNIGGKTALPVAMPFKILFNHDKGVALVDGPNVTKELHSKFKQRLDKYLATADTYQKH